MGAVLFVITIGGLLAALALFVLARVSKAAWLARFTVGGVAIWSAFYCLILLGSSFASTEKTLSFDEPKAFCGFYLDCHLHTMVTGVRRVKQIEGRSSKGEFYIVGVKIFSNARNPSISLRLVDPKAEVVDAAGNRIERNIEAEGLLPTGNIRLGQDVKGSQTIEKEIVFDVPDRTSNPHLSITEGHRIDKIVELFLVDDEDSIFHKQNYFELREQNETAGL